MEKKITFWEINPRKDWVDFIVCALGVILLLAISMSVIVHFYTITHDIAPIEIEASRYYSLIGTGG